MNTRTIHADEIVVGNKILVPGRHGVAPEDWTAASAWLSLSCVDVLVAVSGRPRTD